MNAPMKGEIKALKAQLKTAQDIAQAAPKTPAAATGLHASTHAAWQVYDYHTAEQP